MKYYQHKRSKTIHRKLPDGTLEFLSDGEWIPRPHVKKYRFDLWYVELSKKETIKLVLKHG